MLVHPARVRPLSNAAPRTGPVVYWQSRDQRAGDNWALLWAAEQARKSGAPTFGRLLPVPDLSRRHLAPVCLHGWTAWSRPKPRCVTTAFPSSS